MTDVTTGATKDTPRYGTYRNADGTTGKMSMFGGTLPEGAEYACLDGCFYPNHIGTDFYHHYKEDIALFAQMGFKMFRMSISWPRIYPNGNDEKPNQEGLDFYRSVFEELHKYGIEPLVTISHYDDPLIMTILCIWKKNWAAGKIVKQMGYMKSIVTVFLKSIKI